MIARVLAASSTSSAPTLRHPSGALRRGIPAPRSVSPTRVSWNLMATKLEVAAVLKTDGATLPRGQARSTSPACRPAVEDGSLSGLMVS